MKKIIILAIASVLFLFSCKTNEKTEKQNLQDYNVLLAKTVQIEDRIELENKDNPDWVKGFDNVKFTENVFSKIFSGEFAEFSKRENNGFDAAEVKERMGYNSYRLVLNNKTKQNDTIFNKEIKLSEIKELIFEEDWVFNKENLTFIKKVEKWVPIRQFYRWNDFERKNLRYKKIFEINNDKNSNFNEKIAKDYTHVFEFKSEWMKRVGLDKKTFFKFILKNIEKGKIKAYDPIYLVDKSKREFTVEQVKNYAGISFDYEEFTRKVDKLIFIEDWYFDETTFSISKKVKGIGFIADRYNDGWEEKILFFIFFE